MKNKKPTFSVLMSVYKNDNPEHLKLALESIYEKQTKKPDEIVIVFDGPITKELKKVLDDFKKDKDKIVKYFPQKENKGLGEALRIGSEKCTCDYIFRMDSDDISVPERFKLQSDFVTEHPEIDVLGGDIAEFNTDPNESDKRIRSCPEKLEDIIKMCKRRNPMNHVTACIKRKALLNCGGYKPLKYLEDYYLWIRMIVAKKQLANIKETLVSVRVGNGFENRRSSKEQIKGWKTLQDYMLENKIITKKESMLNMAYINTFVRMPNGLKKTLYKTILRKKK
ncbi:glycosyltransferase [Candidatus Saccharibacteria bacterium]|nr:glycosyltransferase [Candidatus Saccharibacteria bacterium]